METPFGVRLGSRRELLCKSPMLGAILMTASCTPTMYKPDVERISTSIDSATESFKTLVNENVAKEIVDRDQGFVDGNARLALGPDCDKLKNLLAEEQNCLVSWSLFRQSPSTEAKPSCTEPAPFAPTPPELQECRLGTMQGGSFVRVPVASANDARNHLRLADALAAYAAQLKAIVSAADGAQLEAATADVGAAAQSLRDKLAASDPTAKPLNIGPIASFIGTGLQLALEARRFAVLKNVAGKADPIVHEASGRLSIFANQLYYINELDPAFIAADDAVERAAPDPSKSSTFATRVAEASKQEQAYAAVAAVRPGDVFKAVADAHHDLVAALDDSSRQIDALKQSVAKLSEKAKALADVLKASEAKNDKKSK